MNAVRSSSFQSTEGVSTALNRTSQYFEESISNAFQDSMYTLLQFPKPREGRFIARYLLRDLTDVTIQNAALTIRKLLENNEYLVPMFPIEFPLLEEEIRNKKYLIVNGQAVCFSGEAEVQDEIPSEYTDAYFCREILKEPVSCCQDHFFEKRYAQLWRERKGNVCPVGEPHLWDSALEIDEIRKNQIDTFSSQNETREAQIEEILIKQESIEAENAILQATLTTNKAAFRILSPGNASQIDRKQGADPITTISGPGKIAIKLGGEKITATLLKNTSKDMGKLIPGVSIAAGCALAYHRYNNGQYGRAVLEGLSGGVSLVPGWGTLLSVGVDILIAGVDYKESVQDKPNLLNDSYKVLGLDTTAEMPLTKEAVDAAFRKLSDQLHPDKALGEDLGEYHVDFFTECQQRLNQAKEIVYKHHEWV